MTNIQDISKTLSEKEELLRIRENVFKSAPEPLKKQPYGLSILTDETLYTVTKPAAFDESNYVLWHEGKVEILPWAEAMEHEKISQNLAVSLEMITPFALRHANTALHIATYTGGWVVHAKENESSRVKISTQHVEQGCDIVFVYAEKNAQIKIIDEARSREGKSARSIVVYAEEGALVEYIHDIDSATPHHVSFFPISKDRAQISYRTSVLSHNGSVLLRSDALLCGNDAHISMHNALVSSGRGIVDVYNVAHHVHSHTKSSLHAAGVVGDEGRMIYRSDIHMNEDNTKDMSGEQKARFVSVSKSAHIDAIPSLDIGQKDVACSHSVSISYLKESDMFYPRLRGLGKKDAESLVLEGLLMSQSEGITSTEREYYVQQTRSKLTKIR